MRGMPRSRQTEMTFFSSRNIHVVEVLRSRAPEAYQRG